MPDGPAARRLVLVRHGQTAWNAERRAQGHSDVPLDATGRAQAATVGPHLAALAPTLLWSSDLARAVQTADAISGATGLEARLDPRLREFHLGERTGLTMAEYAAAHPDEYHAFRAGRFEVVPGGETTDQVVGRVGAAVREALAALAPGETGVVVSHGGAIRVTLLDLLGWPQSAVSGLHGLANCGWAELQDSGVDRALRLVRYNATAPEPPDFATPEAVG